LASGEAGPGARLRIAAIWSLSWWPALNFMAANWEEILRGGFFCIAGVLAIALSIAAFGHLWFRLTWNRWRDDIVVPWTVALSLFFGYLLVRDAFVFVFTRASIKLPPSAGWFAVAAVAMYLGWRWHKVRKAQVAAIIFSLVGGISAATLLLVTMIQVGRPSTPGVTGAALHPRVPGMGAAPNVYYIILDGYTGNSSLRNALDFDNTPFLQRMSARGFRDMSRAYSNYIRTVQTIGGIFSLQYPHTEDPRSWKDRNLIYPTQFDGVRPPALIERLQADGYATWFSASVVTGCPSRHVRCIGSTVAVDATYMTHAFLTSTPAGRVLMQAVNARRNALEPLATHLPAMLAEHQPLFVFVHHLAPHPPFSLDRNCRSRHPGAEILDTWRAVDREGYVEGLQCVNLQVEHLVDRILAVDAGALVVVQSDHGSGLLMNWEAPMSTWTDLAVGERASYLNLVRAPEACAQWVKDPLGQINTARFVAGCAGGRAPEFLEEHTYISTYTLGPEQDVVREWHPPSD